MTHAKLAPVMGLMMGGMIPLMMHGQMGGAGAAFLLSHVVLGLAALTLALVVPSVRRWVGRHKPTRAMGLKMGLGALVGFALICSHCLVTLHGTI
ncbi:hypothetical protein [Jannaschia donghaensis]|uniref:Uncharacterized protein n=1 Tax=Jannaschia donghaensis TaxID=420998 RepID=A0A0M6YGV1_9RHOB|nr:hypothetical protein [Jannaschia donghaensis]CTQ49578.1 hypothetical protein JDO7802_01592 [Jannaschia donghaensis]